MILCFHWRRATRYGEPMAVRRGVCNWVLIAGLAGAALSVGCSSKPEVVKANVRPGAMPSDGDWRGVYYDTVYGYLHLTTTGDTAMGKWRTAAGDKWGEMSGKVDGVRLPKEIFYASRVMQNSVPDLHLIGHWNYPADTKKTVSVVATLCDAVELFVNGRSLDEHFGNAVDQADILMPFRVTGTEGRFNAMIKVEGGGYQGQAGAIRHGIARALLQSDPEARLPLRQAGFLSRDPRMKERKKYGLKRARKAPQYTKR